MVKRHGAGQQRKLAKKKAMRSQKKARLSRRDSMDPGVRLHGAEKWPVVSAYVAEDIWEDGIGYLVIARQEGEARVVFASFLIDVYCLGVKDAFWKAGSPGDFKEMLKEMDSSQSMVSISPACLVKLVTGAAEYADSFGFRPHPDYRHAALLLKGIDPQECTNEFTFGHDGRPFYIQGPHESPAQVAAIMERIRQFGGHYLIQASPENPELLSDPDGFDAVDDLDLADDSH